jgi:lycopene beta-cyclase
MMAKEPNHYDFILAGGGAAGLSLACAMARSPLADRSILIVDREAKTKNDRTWCFWSDHLDPFDKILYRQWDAVRFTGRGFDRRLELGNFHYKMIRGIDFYEHAHRLLSTHPNVKFLSGQIDDISESTELAKVTVAGQSYTADWVFDSRILPGSIAIDRTRYHDLKQHFKGWIVETEAPAFDPQTPTLFDFRVQPHGDMRFFYILPFSERNALVEFTLFSATLLSEEEYRAELKNYLEHTLVVGPYRILEEESGMIPMTDQPFPRRLGNRIMATGTLGGRIKPSTGYAFARIQKDSAAIVASLVQQGHPFAVPSGPVRYHWFDRTMLQVIYRRGDEMGSFFTQMFQKNPIQRIFRFLNEENTLLEDMRLLSSLPVWPFLQAFVKVNLLGRV